MDICSASNQICKNNPGSFVCQTIRTITICQQSNPCRIGNCFDVPNAPTEYRCECPEGYEFDGTTCTDINECIPNPCGRGECRNLPGAYLCLCPIGFNSVDGTCVDRNECVEQPSICNTGTCENTPGSYECFCPDGFQAARGTCLDIDECVDLRACGPIGGHTCENLIGSWRCICQPGFEYIGDICVDIDECAQSDGDLCIPGRCENTPGSFRCHCPPGFQFIGQDRPLLGFSGGSRCVDINECELLGTPCGRRGTCLNTIGSYECECDTGYEFNPSTGVCTDINECLLTNPCGVGTCRNLPGRYRCFCPQGYQFIDGGTCVNINECVETPNICGDAQCIDEEGGYHCICPSDEFVFVPSSLSCVRIRQTCESISCGINAICDDVGRDAECKCPDGFKGNPLVRCVLICDLECGRFARCVLTPEQVPQCVCEEPLIFDRNRGCIERPPDCSLCAPNEICRILPDQSVVCESCEAGYEISADRTECIDINECVVGPPPCPTDFSCVNKPGTFECISEEQPPVPVPEIVIECLANGADVLLNKAARFEGAAYIKGRSKDRECAKYVSPDETRVVFQLRYGTCGVTPLRDDVSVRVAMFPAAANLMNVIVTYSRQF